MGGMKDYNRGFNAGYNPIGSGRVPRNFAEMVGHQAGQAARERQLQPPSPRPAPKPPSNGPSVPRAQASPMTFRDAAPSPRRDLRSLLLVVALPITGISLLLPNSTVKKLLVMLLVAVAFTQIGRARRVFGPLTSVYAGVLIGLFLGCIELLATGGRYGLSNLWIFLFLGAAIGAVGVPVALARRALRAKKPR